eukprot:2028869-Rhodomonas_salina.1
MGVNCPVVSDEDLSVIEFACRLDLSTKACKINDYLFEADVYVGVAVVWIASSKASTPLVSKKHTCQLASERKMTIIVNSKIGKLNVPACESREKCWFCSKLPDHFHDPISSHRNSCVTDGVFPVNMLRR